MTNFVHSFRVENSDATRVRMLCLRREMMKKFYGLVVIVFPHARDNRLAAKLARNT